MKMFQVQVTLQQHGLELRGSPCTQTWENKFPYSFRSAVGTPLHEWGGQNVCCRDSYALSGTTLNGLQDGFLLGDYRICSSDWKINGWPALYSPPFPVSFSSPFITSNNSDTVETTPCFWQLPVCGWNGKSAEGRRCHQWHSLIPAVTADVQLLVLTICGFLGLECEFRISLYVRKMWSKCGWQ